MTAALLFLGYYVAAISRPASADTGSDIFVIKRGEGVHGISQRLQESGLVRNKWDFEVYVWLQGWGPRLQAGEYRIPKNVNIRELARMLAFGHEAAPERSITIVEGWTIDDIAGYLEREGVVGADDFRAATSRMANSPLISSLQDKPAEATLEGYLFPDTYRILKGATAEELVLKMLTNFEAKLTPELRQAIAARGQSVFATITMASILEREIRRPADLPVAAGVFYARLSANKLLESDATLNYVLPATDRKSRLNAVDLNNPSPYNSYRHVGLPPGPISNPGLKAIEAAIYPEQKGYWFFLTKPDGETIFSKTGAEHLRNKQRYLR